ncbi:MAG: alpha/beta fold hydrolase, partial [Sulfuricurvum sp.]|nr:alpha/beta fold hydrolase [Sulfuricurvum sp.]
MSNKRRILNWIFLIFLIIYLLGGILLMFFQRSFIYFPSTSVYQGLKEMMIDAKDAKLKIIVLNEGHDDAILYFGGNAEAVDAYQQEFSQYFNNYTIYLVNYRGYGGSTGKPNENALYEDALLVYDKLKIKHKNIAIIGRSLGSGVATYVASKRDIKKLILVTPFDSFEEIAKKQFPIYPIKFMLFDRYDSIDRAEEIKARTLILMARNDILVPNENSIRLYAAFDPLKVHKQIFEGFGHNDIQLATQYYSTMEGFLNREITLDFNELNSDLSEADIVTKYKKIKFSCGNERSAIAERYCYADIDRFNGTDARLIVFFFDKNKLVEVKIDLEPGDNQKFLIDRYTQEFG